MDRRTFYGSGLDTADALSIEHQETVDATVKMKMAKAREDLGALEALVGRPEFDKVTAEC